MEPNLGYDNHEHKAASKSIDSYASKLAGTNAAVRLRSINSFVQVVKAPLALRRSYSRGQAPMLALVVTSPSPPPPDRTQLSASTLVGREEAVLT